MAKLVYGSSRWQMCVWIIGLRVRHDVLTGWKKGTLPLVVNVHSADIIATLISLKKEVESKTGNAIKLTIAGATEAHLLAAELAQANVGVIVTPSRSFVRSYPSPLPSIF